MNVMPPSIAAWTSRVDSRSVFGTPMCQPPSASSDTGIPERPNGRVGTSPDDADMSPPLRRGRSALASYWNPYPWSLILDPDPDPDRDPDGDSGLRTGP